MGIYPIDDYITQIIKNIKPLYEIAGFINIW